MRNLVFFFLLSCSFFQVNGQVYSIESLDKQIALGPDNISGVTPSVSAHYMIQIQNYKKALQDKMAGKISELEKLKAKKKSKKERKEIEEVISFMTKEIIILSKLLKKWEDTPNNLANQLQFYNEWRENPCHEITSASGTYSPEEYDVKLITGKNKGIFIETIHLVYIPGAEKWVKKKTDRNCKSSNPDDCLVWCLVKTKGTYQVKGFKGITYPIEVIPNDYLYSEEANHYSRDNNYTDENPKIEVKLKSNQEIVNIQKWKIVDCK